MKTATFALTAWLAATAALAADPVTGTWRTQPGDSGASLEVAIADCGTKVCGVITKVVNGTGATNPVGKTIIWDMDPAGGGAYRNGKIWAPDRDKVYRSKMTLSGNSLKVEGCVAGGLICRGQTWTRIR